MFCLKIVQYNHRKKFCLKVVHLNRHHTNSRKIAPAHSSYTNGLLSETGFASQKIIKFHWKLVLTILRLFSKPCFGLIMFDLFPQSFLHLKKNSHFASNDNFLRKRGPPFFPRGFHPHFFLSHTEFKRLM